jgi:rhamnosyltransferase
MSLTAIESQQLPSLHSTAALVVTHHPDSDLPKRLEKIATQVRTVFVVDNSGRPGIESALSALPLTNVELIANTRNEGLGYALNQGMRRAIEQGFPWVLTLDQDTDVDHDMVSSLSRIVCAYPDPFSIAVAASNARSRKSGRLYLRSRGARLPYREVKTPMTSGSLHSTAIYSRIGGFRSEFFIGAIDLEYCLRARANGFRVICSEEPLMTHAAGATDERQFMGRTVLIAKQSLPRWYLDFRNLAWTVLHYCFREPVWTVNLHWAILKRLILLAVFERNRRAKAKAICRGICDGLSEISGRNSLIYPDACQDKQR